MPLHPIPVTVRSADPLSRAGATSLLRHEPSVDLVESLDRAGSEVPERPWVIVLVAGRLDESTVADVRRCGRGHGQRVVLVVEKLREPELLTVLECGVRAIVWRSAVTPNTLLAGIRAAARGESVLPPDLLDQLVTHVGRTRRAGVHGTSASSAAVGLAAREIDVLRLLGEGLETREIAEKLAYSERTIKSVLHGIMGRLQLRNRAHAVAFALREGYI
jgi:DNA-binding NarL/FixJ family response regulator